MLTPNFHFFMRDVTEYYAPALIERCGGKILDVYVFNKRRHVHCCELTPSYELHFVEAIPGGKNPRWEIEGEPDLDEVLREANRETDAVIYIHCRSITRSKKYRRFCRNDWRKFLTDCDGNEDQAYEKALEAVLEDIHANVCY